MSARVSSEEKKPTITGHIEGLYKRSADLAAQVVGSPQPWPDILLPQCTEDRLPGLRIPLYLREYPDKKFLITVRDAVAHDMAHAEARHGGGCLVGDLAKSRGRKVRISHNDKDLEILSIEFLEEGSMSKSR